MSLRREDDWEKGNVGPSGIVYRMLSTAEVPSHVCKYPGQVHAYDEARRDQEGTSTLRLQEETTFLKTLIDEWFQKGILVSSFSVIDTTHRVSHSSQSELLLRDSGLSTQDCQTRKPDSYTNKTNDVVIGTGGPATGVW